MTIMDESAEYWSGTENAFYCLIDRARTLAFGQGITNTVEPGDVVVDMGAGTGILSLFALRAGAKRVYAVESDIGMARTLAETFKANGFFEKTVILNRDVCTVELPEEVDVVIGEMVASGLIDEKHILANNNILKFAKPKCKVVLKEIELYIDIVYNNDLYYGFSMPIVRYEINLNSGDTLKSSPLSEQRILRKVDFSKYIDNTDVNETIEVRCSKAGVANGIRLSAKTNFFDGSYYGHSFSYSFPVILPITPIEVKEGTVYSVKIAYRLCEGFEHVRYEVLE